MRYRRLLPIAACVALLASVAGGALPSGAAQASGRVVLTSDDLRLTLFGQASFTLATADGRDLLFPEETSFVSLRVDGSVYGPVDSSTQQLDEPYTLDSTTAVERLTTAEGVIFTVRYSLDGPSMRLAVEAENASSTPHSVAVRVLLDTQVGINDGSPLWHSGTVYTREVELAPPVNDFMGYDAIPATLTSYGVFETQPERVLFAHWPEAVDSEWDYTVDPSKQFYTPGITKSPLSDSSVMVFYDLGSLAAGQKDQARLYYGSAAPNLDLITELERLKKALLDRIDSDLDYVTAVQVRTYQVIQEQADPAASAKTLIDAAGWGSAAVDLLEYNPAGIVNAVATETYGRYIDGIGDDLRNGISQALPAIYRDITLPPDSPQLRPTIRQTLAGSLGTDEQKRRITGAFEALEEEIRTGGLPADYPLDEVIDALGVYRNQLVTTTFQEGAVFWPDPATGAASSRVSGLLPNYVAAVDDLREQEGRGESAENIGYIIAGGVAIKCLLAIGTGGGSIPIEVIASALGGGTAVTLIVSGKAAEVLYDAAHASYAFRSLTTMAEELKLVDLIAANVEEAVPRAQDQLAAWQPEGAVTDVMLGDISIDEGELLGTGNGQVNVRNSGSEPFVATVYATLLAHTQAGQFPVSILGQPVPVSVPPGQEAGISFQYGAPDSRVWRQADLYTVDLWVGAGQRLIHVSDDPAFAARLRISAASGAAGEALAGRQVAVVDSGVLGQSETSRSTLTFGSSTARTTVELSYPGSDFDLHLYDAEGRHVGLNYDTGEVEAEIPGVTYSGARARPEWATVEGHAGETWEVEVVAVQTDKPEAFAAVSTQLTALPVLLGVDPVQIAVADGADPSGAAATVAVYEYGGADGVDGIEGSVTALTREAGKSLPASGLSLSLPASVGAGASADGQLSVVSGRALRSGTYSGELRVRGTAAGSGTPVEVSVPVTLVVEGGSGGLFDSLLSNKVVLGVSAALLAALVAVVIWLVVRRARRSARASAPQAMSFYPTPAPPSVGGYPPPQSYAPQGYPPQPAQPWPGIRQPGYQAPAVPPPPGYGQPGYQAPAVPPPPGYGQPAYQPPAVPPPPGYGQPAYQPPAVPPPPGYGQPPYRPPATPPQPGYGQPPYQPPAVPPPPGYGQPPYRPPATPPQPGYGQPPYQPPPATPPQPGYGQPPYQPPTAPAKCPRCGSPVRAGARFCGVCRQPLQTS